MPWAVLTNERVTPKPAARPGDRGRHVNRASDLSSARGLGYAGSGKSNLMNAFCFVLCESKSDMRADKLGDLIYNGGAGEQRSRGSAQGGSCLFPVHLSFVLVRDCLSSRGALKPFQWNSMPAGGGPNPRK